mmetsp:Transcript_31808/g.67376  ORF Transcript_31808/g.67376 Transcript_31808/m.67376 type:complete len:542 (+) Transcript_31808:310-1935(+)|eukprot:CAMPEP_0183705072 /NCGR_PEP_ID=MMETSP0737-20130205/2241_1 /TAXON_ID=385413 /ORGANISM="Thalassiosira miniscula, Strain CCMP1093" /LENGTH=541 /DNA_ID=CAMNT_0025932133 /DNA_START=393 /DNA_END=2018 /DNA_ORIENTATION=-
MVSFEEKNREPYEEEKEELLSNKVTTESHTHFAGRVPAGSQIPICVAKNGVNHVINKAGSKKNVFSIGLACSECFSGPRLAELLRPGFEYEQKVMMDLLAGNHAAPLSIHTSGGVSAALSDFISALEPHLPWEGKDTLDWCVSLQLEGASAVWAGIDMLLQLQMIKHGNDTKRKMVAVGAKSYHGPPSTSLGSSCPLFTKHNQTTYPVPIAGESYDEKELLVQFEDFLEKHSEDVGVLLIEPQWGSSQVGLPWPKDLVKAYIKKAQAKGILVLADEIMCGLGRHGQGKMFLSDCWELDPDAVTFGKAIGGGVFPLSGAVIKTGGQLLGSKGRTVMQSHTFAGSSVRALMTGVEVLNTLPLYFHSIKKLGDEMKVIFRHLEKISNGLIYSQGQGLMWGALVSRKGIHKDEAVRAKTIACLKKNLEKEGVLPYFVPVGGFMVSPVVDIDVGTLYTIAEKMEVALKTTADEVNWVNVDALSISIRVSLQLDNEFCTSEVRKQCLSHLHFARTCTSCGTFVRPELRKRFSLGLLELESFVEPVES